MADFFFSTNSLAFLGLKPFWFVEAGLVEDGTAVGIETDDPTMSTFSGVGVMRADLEAPDVVVVVVDLLEDDKAEDSDSTERVRL
jgi:hypothetical protein